MPNKPRLEQKSKLEPIETFFVTDALHFETEYLVLRSTDALRLVEKLEQLIRSILKCIEKVVKDDAEMGLLRKESVLFDIRVDPDKERARVELQRQLVELKKQHKTLKTVISAIKKASKSSRMFTPADFERVPPDAIKVVLASLHGEIVQFERIGGGYLAEPIATSDPRVVAELARRHIGHPVVVEY